MYHDAAPTHEQHRRPPSMADLWAEFPDVTGQLVGAVAHQVAMTAPAHPHPGMPVQLAAEPQTQPTTRPYADGLAWQLLKHVMQLALVASVLLLVLHGGEMPMMALSYVATGLLLMGVISVIDRQRYADHDVDFEVLAVVAPPTHHQQPAVVPMVHVGPLGPLIEQMQHALPDRVSVT